MRVHYRHPLVEGGLEEVVLRWFTDTQASLVLHDGKFPGWFRGLAARRDAEDLLRDKVLGTFLIRLSDKTIGYVLSYRGLDRCRHFVIRQNQDGLLVVSGDDRTHGSLGQLIEHYRLRPIQPFGEYLTFGCHQTEADELYDVVSHRKSGVSVRALRAVWDQEDLRRDHRTQRQEVAPAAPPPGLPPKSRARRLMGTVSAGAASQGLPPVPRRGLPLGVSLSGSSGGSWRDPQDRLGGTPHPPPRPGRVRTDGSDHLGDPSPLGPERSRAKNKDKDKDKDSSCSSTPSRRVTCLTYSLHPPRPDGSRSDLLHLSQSNPLYQSTNGSRASPALSNSLYQSTDGSRGSPAQSNLLYQPTDGSRGSPAQSNLLYQPTDGSRGSPAQSNLLYQPTDGSRGSPAQSNLLYQPTDGSRGSPAQSNLLYQPTDGSRGSPAQSGDGTYADIPIKPAEPPEDTYESLEDMKTRESKSSGGKYNIKWRKFLPDYMKK
ncbi:SH2 domain-containing protein 7 [Salarias fasciatus]|uniref:SH2 domain-containing protein 7 n=1 Tax=Salarias fasciatus TaxID=181472 RepID=UPI0011769B66|nr:SH2 domain-containing protein 7-like [Salarias fasciatus]